MILIKKLNESLFKLEKFNFIVGEYATYNNYYKVSLQQNEYKIEIGLQVVSAGIKPQISLHGNRILIGAGNKLYVYDLSGNLIKEHLAYPIFYEFIIIKDCVLVINELNVFLLDADFDKVWDKNFDEIVDIVEVNATTIVLCDYNGIFINIDILTGDKI